ncbi:hypothetical protein [Aneurinibacillus tyrosinisolvens]|uniref:hypothetical protein n=1 Tax=Aneurinibacillus tyrosinisolvens TaxID=1443435 RepID=UPI00063F2570|nr:hypothetical protein [Aneurinibacillus tyrosinisolvens]
MSMLPPYNSLAQVGGFAGSPSMMDGASMMQSGFVGDGSPIRTGMLNANPASVIQPGFANTDVQRVWQQASNDIQRQPIQRQLNQAQFGGVQGGFAGGQGGFTGASMYQQPMMDGNMMQPMMDGSMMQQGFVGDGSPIRTGTLNANPASVIQPGFANTDVQQVRQQIANDIRRQPIQRQLQQAQFGGVQGGFVGGQAQYGGVQGGFAGGSMYQQPMMMQPMMDGTMMQQGYMGDGSPIRTGMLNANPASVIQPGFANTDVQRVWQQASNDIQRQPIQRQLNQAQFGGVQGGFAGGQGGFTGASMYQQPMMDGNMMQPMMDGSMMQQGFVGDGSPIRTGTLNANPASVIQPGFANTDVQRVWQQASNDIQRGAQQNMYPGQAGYAGMQGGFMR